MNSVQWNPWYGCHGCSPGCTNCFVYYFDAMRGRDAGVVTRSKTNFHLPLKKAEAVTTKSLPTAWWQPVFHQTFFWQKPMHGGATNSNNFVMDGKRYTISHKQEYSQARKAMKYLEGLSPSVGGR